LSRYDPEVRRRIATLVESVQGDRTRSNELFEYVWSMVCVRRGLMRVVREVKADNTTQLVLEEVCTGRSRRVVRPAELDNEVEGLAIQALSRILSKSRRMP
jgi:hypothetical protein